MKRILYIVDGNITKETGFSQRIKRQMSVFEKIDSIEIDIINSVSFRDIVKNSNLKKKTFEKYFGKPIRKIYFFPELPLTFFKKKPDVFFENKARRISRILEKENYDIVYCENLRVAYSTYLAGRNKKNFSYIMDYHGAVPEEFRDFGKRNIGKFNYEYLKKMEKVAIENSKKIICVSNSLKNHILNNFQVAKENIDVVPSCVPENYISFNETTRDMLRNELGLMDRKILLYTGSVVSYQCVEEMISLFKELVQFDEKFYFLFCVPTNSIEYMKKEFESAGLSNKFYKITSVPHEKVLNYGMAADYGIIIRDASLVNKVASPTKILEYLSTGLPLIATNNIGDFNDAPVEKFTIDFENLSKKNFSFLFESLASSSKSRKQNFEACKVYLMESFVWERQNKIYSKLLKE